MKAIIRHLTSGEHYLAELDSEGNTIAISRRLETEADMKRNDHELFPWDETTDHEDRWTAKTYIVVQTVGD